MRQCFVQDESCHWYAIPSENRNAWDEWLDSKDAEDGLVPDYAKPLGRHISRYTFENLETTND